MTQVPEMPFLTSDMEGVGGIVKARCEDFEVEEIPLYEATGQGDHVYFRLVKQDLPTPRAVHRIAGYMGVPPREIGYAGLKDARAVTSQLMSLEHADADKLARYEDQQMKVVWVGRHTNKLRSGHLAGNRFRIKVREALGHDPVRRAGEILDVLTRRGVPNYFGEQRFGARGDTARLGELLVRGNEQAFVDALLGQPSPHDPEDIRAARDAYDAGQFARALSRWPRHHVNERKALAAFKKKQRPGHAIRAVDRRMRRLYVSAFQSEMFNELLARRIGEIDRVRVGDMAKKHDTGGVFYVEDIQAEQPRADRFEISATGPVFGYKEGLAKGEPGEMERQLLSEHDITPEAFRSLGSSMKVTGTRRPLRFQLTETAVTGGTDDFGPYVQVCFTAPSGSYATVALREITKAD